jgi:hypothetical protein
MRLYVYSTEELKSFPGCMTERNGDARGLLLNQSSTGGTDARQW